MKAFLITALAGAALSASCGPRGGKTTPSDQTAESAGETEEVKLCDNHTTTTVPADMEPTRENGQKVADALMSQWKQKNPDAEWEESARRSWTIEPPADNSGIVTEGDAAGQTYGRYTERDVLTWEREIERLVLEGARVFHTADELGSTIAVSCDMCHPDGANTHPETYPKYQVQLGRVAHLRDMINWCLEHPVRAEPMEPDDPRMRAMEAYIWAQRRGEELNYGKH